MQTSGLETEREEPEGRDMEPEPESVAPAVETPEPPPPTDDVALAELFDGEEHAVDPASVLVQRIAAMIFTVPSTLSALFGLTLALILGGLAWWFYLALLPALGGLVFLQWRWPVLHFRHLRFRVDAQGLQIRRGVLWRRVISIPTTRVQHTDVTQGPLQRRWNLATLTVHTAGTEGASIPLAGLRHEVALRLRDHLLPKESRGI